MRKIYLLLFAFLTAATMSAQLVITTVSQGVVKLTYGQANDYSLYAPGFGTPSFWVHMWIPTTSYQDDWSNSNVEMVWNPAISAYEATVNFNTKSFTNGNSVLPGNYNITNFGMVFKNQQNGATQQSLTDIFATSNGFTGTTTLGTMGLSDLNGLSGKTFVAEGMLYSSRRGMLAITVYDFHGRIVKSQSVKSDGNPIDLNLSQRGMYMVTINNGGQYDVVKFRQ